MKHFFWVLIFLCFTNYGYSFSPAGYGIDSSTLIDTLPGLTPDPDNDAEVIQAFQAHFIKSVFLEPVFKNTMRFYADDESSGDVMGFGMYDEVMIQQLAQQLAEDDAFHLNDVLLKD